MQNLREKLKKDFAFETELYSKMSVWKNLKFIRHSFLTLEAVARRCSVRKGVLRNFARPAFLLKKRLWHSCFSLNLAKFLRTPVLQNISGGCFWNFCLFRFCLDTKRTWHLLLSPHNHKLFIEFNFIRFCRHFDIKKY